MRTRWAVATLGALALGLLTLNLPMPSWSNPTKAAPARVAASGAACPADAKPANMNFTLKDMDNKDVKLSDYKGKVVLLDFWATWCVPCKMEIPWFVEFQTNYRKAGLQVVGISVDDTVDKLKPYVKDMKMNYPVLQGLGRDDVQDAFGPMFGIPVTVIISRDGKACMKHAGISTKERFEQEIKSLL